jgi:NAD(P)-dependent dehydrogenase (short-subunit alcohol dehydrogenase family)
MLLNLEDKVVLVTGGSKGIGFACAQVFAAEGARVAICSRSADSLAEARRRLPSIVTRAADLRDAAAAAAMVDAVEEALGPIDVLVNSAGAARRTPPDELTPEAWRAAMDAKYFTTINVVDPVIKRMSARVSGVIVTVIGNGGKVASTSHLPGGSANAALMLATAGLGAAYAGKGVRVVGVSPGLTDTGRVAEGMLAEARMAGISPDEARRRAVARLPLGRLASPGEIADAVVFLASERASYISGVTVSLDGALNATIV